MTHHFQQKLINPNPLSTNNVKIISVGSYLPEQVLKSDDIMSEIKSDVLYDIPIDWMSASMGIKGAKNQQ